MWATWRDALFDHPVDAVSRAVPSNARVVDTPGSLVVEKPKKASFRRLMKGKSP
jgi:hypothetical protein